MDQESIEKDLIRNIPVAPNLKGIIYEKVQTRDVFHIGFYSENNHDDIDVYEFSDFKDIYYEVRERLCDLNLDPTVRFQLLRDLLINKNRITENIRYFGVPHIYD